MPIGIPPARPRGELRIMVKRRLSKDARRMMLPAAPCKKRKKRSKGNDGTDRLPRRWAQPVVVLILVLLFVALSAHAWALDPSRTLTQYVQRIWQLQNGL